MEIESNNLVFIYDPILHSLRDIHEKHSCDDALCNQNYHEILCHKEYFTIQFDLGERIQQLKVIPSKYNSYDDLIDKIKLKYDKMKSIQDEIHVKKKQLEVLTNRLKSPKISSNEIDWKELVLQEEQLRMSSEIANKYRETETDASMIDWIEYTARFVQPRILETNGLEVTPENLYNLRAAAHQTDVFWIKYNRARRGDLRVDDPVPQNVIVYDPLSSQNSLLLSICQQNSRIRPLILLAGSVS